MTKSTIVKEYITWLRGFVEDDPMNSDYDRLFSCLYNSDFYSIVSMDINRESDGIELRYQFIYESKYGRSIPVNYLDDGKPCSILEMMIALAVRCEGIMFTPDKGDRTGIWFWQMVDNLGLRSMTDDHFDKRYVKKVITRLCERTYRPDGEGGLFTVRNRNEDLRNIEIWYQAMWYLDEYYLCERSM